MKIQVRISIGNVDVDLTLLIFLINQSLFCLFMREKEEVFLFRFSDGTDRDDLTLMCFFPRMRGVKRK